LFRESKRQSKQKNKPTEAAMGERKILLDRIKNNLQKLFVIRY